MEKNVLLFLFSLILIVTVVQAKICWKHCSEDDPKLIRSFNIDGCRRRKRVSVSGERGFMNFRCDGSNPPPCTIKRGDTVYLDVEFAPDFPLKKMTQGAYWVNSWGFQIPFPGMDTQGCKYLRHNCMNETVSENQNFSYPVKILTAYPPGVYNLKWNFQEEKYNNGTNIEVGCAFYTIRIL